MFIVIHFFYNLPIRKKQLIGLLISEMISIIGLVGVGTYLIILGGREQLIQQAKSELAVTKIQYNIKVDQMGFGFRGQSDNAAIIEAAKLHDNGNPLNPNLRNQVKQILKNEIQARNIEYATLVGKDLRIIVNGNNDRTGEIFNPNNLVNKAIRNLQQVKSSEFLNWVELSEELAPLPKGMSEQDILIRYTATPVFNKQTQAVIGVLISGDIVNGKSPIMEQTVKTLNGGYSAIYLLKPSQKFTIVTGAKVDKTSQSSSVKNELESLILSEHSLLNQAISSPLEIVTGREKIGNQTYTIAAQALLNYLGEPVGVLVRGTPENGLNLLLKNSLFTQLIMAFIAVVADIYLAILLSNTILRPINHLRKQAQKFASGNFQTRAKLFGSDELGELTISFNEMADKLVANIQKIEIQGREYKALNTQLQQEISEKQQAKIALEKSEIELKENNYILKQTLEELQTTQTQIIQNEKMTSLGHLVAGVAHEINNPVCFIHGNLSYLQEYSQNLLSLIQLYQQNYPHPTIDIQTKTENIDLKFIQEDLPKILTSMNVGTTRIQQIVLSLRNFYRMDESELKFIDIHEGIDNTLLILQHRLHNHGNFPGIKIIKDYANLPLVECYVGQINQVFMNIIVNAIYALEEYSSNPNYHQQSQRQLLITIRTCLICQESIQIAIADNANGMSETVKSNIFNPFFTTKPVGKGTGLGMAISYQIITQKHHGKLNFFSEISKGTEFIIQIPIYQSSMINISKV